MFIRTILLVVFAVISSAAQTPNVIAEDNATIVKKEAAPQVGPKSMDTIKDAVQDLTEEQKEKLQGLQKKAVAQQKALFDSANIPWKLSKQRREAYQALKAKGLKGKELAAQANKEAGYTKEQAAAQTKVGKVWNDYRFALVSVLTDDQRKELPEWLANSHAARVKAEQEKAAAKKQ